MAPSVTRLLVLSTILVGCGNSCPRTADDETGATEAASAREPARKEAREEPAEKEDRDEHVEEQPGASASSAPPTSTASPEASKPPSSEPQFPEHASVSQAMAAIPAGTERANIEPDLLSAPLQDEALYEPCKLGTQHFKIRVAVWDGHAVGVDVTTTNKKLAECVDERVRSIEWKKKVKSLNTVEFAL